MSVQSKQFIMVGVIMLITALLWSTAIYTIVKNRPAPVPVQYRTGDLNHDGHVDVKDLSILAHNFDKPQK